MKLASSKRTRPERIVARILHSLFPGEVDEQARDLPGTPDFVMRRRRVAVFVHGCFWHACPACYRPPRRNAAFWARKARRNRLRDIRCSGRLRRKRWEVLVVWEHDTRQAGELKARLGRMTCG